MSVKAIPEGYHTITPYLIIKDANGLISFLKKAFDATEVYLTRRPDGAVMHATLKVGDSMLMLAEASENYPPVPGAFYLYVENTDTVYKQAVSAGGVSIMEPADQFYGDRNAGVKDAHGNSWWIATHLEDVSPEEMKKREEAFFKKTDMAASHN